MPKARPYRRKKSAAPRRGDGALRVFSVNRPPEDPRGLARLLGAIALERQAALEGRPAPYLAGRDKLADLRPAHDATTAHGSADGNAEASDA